MLILIATILPYRAAFLPWRMSGRLLMHRGRNEAARLACGARLADVGLHVLAPRHLPVLRGLDAVRGSRASALARDAGVTRKAIAQVVAELEQFDIVEQAPDPTDARAKIVRYT